MEINLFVRIGLRGRLRVSRARDGGHHADETDDEHGGNDAHGDFSLARIRLFPGLPHSLLPLGSPRPELLAERGQPLLELRENFDQFLLQKWHPLTPILPYISYP